MSEKKENKKGINDFWDEYSQYEFLLLIILNFTIFFLIIYKISKWIFEQLVKFYNWISKKIKEKNKK